MLRQLFLVALVILLTACSVSDSGVQYAPTPTPAIDRLAVPPLSDDPTQLEAGAFIYKQVCMACHGDLGQGLTEEWRLEWEEDYNCWQSECHSPSHPPWGFEIPRTCCPAVSGPGTLMRFDTAAELYTYLTETMPWWSPGNRSNQEYWDVTAYLISQNGALPADVELNAGNAMVIQLRPASSPPGDILPAVIILAAALIMAAGLLAIQNRWYEKSA
jgi:hypothetical protein